MNPILRARELLGDATPLLHDCGRLCGAACCGGDDTDGMLLFPGEETLFENKSGFTVITRPLADGSVGKIIVCGGSCCRDDRPLSCRIFPLVPHFTPDGILKVRLDARGRPICPLARQKKAGLAPAFVTAVEETLRFLDTDPEQHRFLMNIAADEQGFRDLRL